LKATWGDWRVEVDEVIAEGDRVMLRWTFHGTQQGEYLGYPATGRQVSHTGINIFRIENGKIAEMWDLYDRLWLWQQLGAIPETRELIASARKANGFQ